MEAEPKSATAGPAEKEFDIFTGDTSGKLPLAKIKTHASTFEPPKPEKREGFGDVSKEHLNPESPLYRSLQLEQADSVLLDVANEHFDSGPSANLFY
jgi:hypothetical protein